MTKTDTLPTTWDEAQIGEALGMEYQFLCFWRRPERPTLSHPGIFSQWLESPIVENGITYKTAEHYMMAYKALVFGDLGAYERILALDHPSHVKQAGRQIVNFDEEEWGRVRWSVAVNGNLLKFTQQIALQKQLLATDGCILVEASPYDRVWGIGLSADEDAASSPAGWRGENLLGFALMEVRNRLKA